MTTGETAAFVCTACGLTVAEAHVPPSVPSCPSCGAKTRPNEAMKLKAGNVKCAACGHEEQAYKGEQCPECDTIYGTFATRQA